MKLLKGAGIIFLSIVLIILLLVSSLSFTANTLLHPTIYTEAFEKGQVYSYLDENLANSQATFIAIPEEGSKVFVENLLSNFLAYLRSDTDNLNLSVKIDKDKLRNFFLGYLKDLQQCRPGQDPYNSQNPCLPSGMNSSEFLDVFLKKQNFSFFEQDTVDLASVYSIEPGSDGRESLDNIRQYIQYYQFSNIVLIMIILIILGLIYVIQRPNTRSFLRVSALCFIIPSIMVVGIILAIKSLNYNSVMDPTLIKVISVLINVFSENLIFCSLILASISIALLATSFIIKKQDKVKEIK